MVKVNVTMTLMKSSDHPRLSPVPKSAASKSPILLTTEYIKCKISRIARIRITIYGSLLLSLVVASYWYNFRLMSHPLWVHLPQNAVLSPEADLTTMTKTAGVPRKPSREEMLPVLTTTIDVENTAMGVVPRSEELDDDNDDPMDSGILSSLNQSFFWSIQTDIDEMEDPNTRCQRYNYKYNANSTIPLRRIFYGSLIADETYELLNIVAAEGYQIYSGMVFVESNRTQSFVNTRDWKHAITSTSNDGSLSNRRQHMIASLFGMEDINHVRIKPFINENKHLRSLYREHKQRDLIIEGWKELGMQPEDIGIIADLDETFSRDYLRAIQTCSDIPQFQYHQHYCHHESVKIVAKARVYETSPQCRTQDRHWYHPDIIIGHCIDGIADEQRHPSAPRVSARSFLRAPGFGQNCDDWYNQSKITNNQYPSWNAADFRRTCSGGQHTFLNYTYQESKHHTAYHFHNFFIHMNTTRYKYFSYGHADEEVYQKPIYQMSDDLQMMYNCVNDLPDLGEQKWKRSVLNEALNPLDEPIYFMDKEYRQRRHAHVRAMVKADDEMLEQIMTLSVGATAPTDTHPSKDQITQHDHQHTQYVPFFDTYNDRDESVNAAVMVMASNCNLWTYKLFVGSLRYSGYTGHIIVALEPNPSPKIVNYLIGKNVTIKTLSWTNCTYAIMDDSNKMGSIESTVCAYPYSNIKMRWSRFPLMRDWLIECTTCTGPVLIASTRDLIFQRNPFGIHAPKVTGLQLYQEHVDLTTKHWLASWPLRECKAAVYDEPMLCSGITIGTRDTMIEYLTIMYEEMKVWMNDPKCRFNINRDDQAIHNFLYYSGNIPNKTTVSVPNRMGGIVNAIGHHAARIQSRYISQSSKLHERQYPGASNNTWIGRTEFGLTNDEGFLVELDGKTLSFVVHEWDRFGAPYRRWLKQQPWAHF